MSAGLNGVRNGGVSVQAAAILALLGIAGGGGGATYMGNAQAADKIEKQDDRINALERGVAVIEQQTRETAKDVDEVKQSVDNLDGKIDDVLREVRK